MKGLVIYSSRYGSTREYAEALAEKLGWEAVSYKNVNTKMLNDAEAVALASNVRIGKMKVATWAKSKTSILNSKCKAVIAVGGTETENQKYYLEIVEKNFPFLDLKKEQIFGLGGRQIMSDMKGMDSFMFKMMDKMMKDSPEKREMMQEVDHVDINHIEAIVSYLKK
jgi:menaquinone-dependent protoporphyrinogen oxidase